MPTWRWESVTARYRDADTGRFLGRETILEWTTTSLEVGRGATREYAQALADGRLNVRDWQEAMRDEVRTQYVMQYVAGRGGYGAMTDRDWERLEAQIRGQYEYLDGFAKALADGELTQAQVENRAGMYVDGAEQAFWQGTNEARGMPELPAQPKDGSTSCLTGCACEWEIEETDEGWEATWKMNPEAEHCPDCEDRSIEWSPLICAFGETDWTVEA